MTKTDKVYIGNGDERIELTGADKKAFITKNQGIKGKNSIQP